MIAESGRLIHDLGRDPTTAVVKLRSQNGYFPMSILQRKDDGLAEWPIKRKNMGSENAKFSWYSAKLSVAAESDAINDWNDIDVHFCKFCRCQTCLWRTDSNNCNELSDSRTLLSLAGHRKISTYCSYGDGSGDFRARWIVPHLPCGRYDIQHAKNASNW